MTRTTTTRGVLWEVMAPLVRWPMYSPLRLGLVLVAVVAALVVVGKMTGDGPPGSDAAGSVGTPGAFQDPAAEGGPTDASEAGAHASEPTSAGTERVVEALARRFVVAYLEPDGPRPRWLGRLRGMATPELGRALATVDRADVAELGREVVDVDVRGVGATAAAAVVTTDGGELTVDVAHSGQDWQVARVVPSDPGERGAA